MARATQLPPPLARDDRKSWSILLLLTLFVLYWFFARYLERIEITTPPQFWQAFVSIFWFFDIFTGPILFAAEMFSPRVLRHLIPVFVGWWLVKQTTLELLVKLYDLPDMKEAAVLLRRLRRSLLAAPLRVFVQRANFAEQRQQETLLRLGGPGEIFVGNSDVVVTERNGRFSRVLGTGLYRLGRFESVRAVLDLRPQEREANNIALVTKEGIKLSTNLSVTFALDRGGQIPSKAQPYPINPAAVRKAAYSQLVLDNGTVSDWESATLQITISQLKTAVAKFRLDELVYPNRPSADPNQAIQAEMERRARAAVARFGAEIISIRLGHLELHPIVTDQRKNVWRATWEKQRRINQADGEAAALEEVELARAEGEAAIIQAILAGIQRARQEGNTSTPREIVALRIIEALEKIARQSHNHFPMEPAQEVLAQLQGLHRQLLTAEASDQATVISSDRP